MNLMYLLIKGRFMQIPQENWLKVLLILCKLILQKMLNQPTECILRVRIDTYFVIPKMGALVVAYF